jgi:hypothetical protein
MGSKALINEEHAQSDCLHKAQEYGDRVYRIAEARLFRGSGDRFRLGLFLSHQPLNRGARWRVSLVLGIDDVGTCVLAATHPIR